MKSKKESAAVAENLENDEPPKPKNFWVNLSAIRSIQRKADGSGQYSVLFVNDTHVYTFNVNPLEMERFSDRENWACL